MLWGGGSLYNCLPPHPSSEPGDACTVSACDGGICRCRPETSVDPLVGPCSCGHRGLFCLLGQPGRERGWWAVQQPLPSCSVAGNLLPMSEPQFLPPGNGEFIEMTCGRAQPGAWACWRLGKGSCRLSCPSGLWYWTAEGRDQGAPHDSPWT